MFDLTFTESHRFEREYVCVHCRFTRPCAVQLAGKAVDSRDDFFKLFDREGTKRRAGTAAYLNAVKNARLALKLCPCPRCGKRDSTAFIIKSALILIALTAFLVFFLVLSLSLPAKDGYGAWIFTCSVALLTLVAGIRRLQLWRMAPRCVVFAPIPVADPEGSSPEARRRSSSPPVPPSKRYYIEWMDSETGPFTLEQLQRMVPDARAGAIYRTSTLQQAAELTEYTLVRVEDETVRRPFGDLLAELAARPAPGAEEARRQAEKDRIDQTGFCSRCLGQSISQSPGATKTRTAFGTRFYGAAEKCRHCYSVVRVLWVVFVFIPVIPLGTYRYQDMASGVFRREFVAKQTRTRWSMVFTHWLVVVAVVVVLALMRYEL